MAAATFFTFYFGFINIRGFPHALRLLRGDYADPEHHGEVSHFQALATAVSGTVGIGNIGGVAVVISLGGPGATFWLMLAGFLGMSTKLAECVAGVKYRRENPDGTVSGGPMYYLEHSLRERGLPFLAKPMGAFYALAIVIGCLGIGNMFQSNQAFNQFLYITGGETGVLADRGWLFGLAIAAAVGVVIIGGLQSIARVTSKLVPFMALTYLVLGSIVVIANAERLPWAIGAIFSEAFAPEALTGGFVGVMILGFQRAVFSNEAGIGSAAIAHSAVRTNEPATEGYVALMEPFIDTVVICTLTALVILTTIYHPDIAGAGVQGVELTSRAFASTLAWSAVPLSLILLRAEGLDLPAWRGSLEGKPVQGHVLRLWRAGLHDAAGCSARFLRRHGFPHCAAQHPRPLPAGAHRQARTGGIPCALHGCPGSGKRCGRRRRPVSARGPGAAAALQPGRGLYCGLRIGMEKVLCHK